MFMRLHLGDKFSQQKKAALCLYQNSSATITSRTRDKRDSASLKSPFISQDHYNYCEKKNYFSFFLLASMKHRQKMVQIRVYFCLALNSTHKLTDIQLASLLGFICKEINEDNTYPATASVEPVLTEQRLSLSLNFAFA